MGQFPSRPLEGSSPPNALLSDFWPPELRDSMCLLFKLPALCTSSRRSRQPDVAPHPSTEADCRRGCRLRDVPQLLVADLGGSAAPADAAPRSDTSWNIPDFGPWPRERF